MKKTLIMVFSIILQNFGYNQINFNQNTNSGLIENKGQFTDFKKNPADFIFFKSESNGLNIYITNSGITLHVFENIKEGALENNDENILSEDYEFDKKILSERIEIKLKNASIKKENIVKEKKLSGSYNYYFSHCPNGIRNVAEFNKIIIKNIYDQIDWVIYITEKNEFKYDFIVHPGGNYDLIKLIILSKNKIQINKNGELEFLTSKGNIKEKKPVSFNNNTLLETNFKINYQNKVQIQNDSGYETEVAFELDESKINLSDKIIIDPQITWSTFYGSSGLDGPTCIDNDSFGNVFVSGYVQTLDFPVFDNGSFFQSTQAGSSNDAFILKFDNNGNRLWSTYYGGTNLEFAYSITVDLFDQIFVTGYSNSTDMPLQDVGTYFQIGGSSTTAFVLKFDNNGNRLWATRYGGSGTDIGKSIKTDNIGNVFMTGITSSTNFPLLNSGTFFQGTNSPTTNEAFIVKFDNQGNQLWATYYGGNESDGAQDLAIDSIGNIYITGFAGNNFPLQNSLGYNDISFNGDNRDAFILKFDNLGNRLWSTYFGGSNNEAGSGIEVDNYGNIFLVGNTQSLDFPTQNNSTFLQTNYGGTGTYNGDIFISKFDSTHNLLWSTYFGGDFDDGFSDMGSDIITLDKLSNIYICLNSNSSNATLLGTFDGGYNDLTYNGFYDNMLLKFNNNGELLWSTYIGGNGTDSRGALSVDSYNNLFYCGEWTEGSSGPLLINSSYPLFDPSNGAYFDGTFNGGYDDGFIMKFESVIKTEGMNYLNNKLDNLLLYPNPTNSFLNLELFDIYKFPLHLKLFDNTSKLILEKKIISSQSILDISNLSSGIYYIQVETGNNMITKKIIKY